MDGDENGVGSQPSHLDMEKVSSLLLLKEVLGQRRRSTEVSSVHPQLEPRSPSQQGARREVPVPIAAAPSPGTHAPAAPSWLHVDVASSDAFQRVVLEGPEVLTAESRSACASLHAALALRQKHAFRLPPYYLGACKASDYMHFVPASAELPERDSIGSPLAARAAANLAQAVGAGEARTPGEAAASSTGTTLPAHVLVGDALVSSGTGKTYPPGMFYRRRPEPPFVPFAQDVPPAADGWSAAMVAGVYQVYAASAPGSPEPDLGLGLSLDGGITPPPPSRGTAEGVEEEGDVFDGGSTPAGGSLFTTPDWEEWSADYEALLAIINSPPVRSFAYRRLQLLGMRFDMHRILNRDREAAEQKAVPHRDFFNTRRVDTHVHHSACMNQKHLLRFIKSKLKREADTVVIYRDGRALTLAEVFLSLNLTAYDLSLDVLDMHADWTVAHRFDRFNTKYNPLGQSRLREIFLKTDNAIQGRFLSELTKEVLVDLEATKYSLAEYRLSIYGKSRDEWHKLAVWIVSNKLASPNVRWGIQIPRLYESMRAARHITTFGDMLQNVFAPLFEVTIDPSRDPVLHQFLTLVGFFDSVDDESKVESQVGSLRDLPPPNEWSKAEQPPYAYQTYYIAANLAVLNQLRRSRQLTEFSFRPHSGEAGSADHLAATFLTAESIAHGINLRRSPVLEYLYYLAQIGIAVSPLSNNRLFLDLQKSPFPTFFERGLAVSLSTDDPLMLHLTKEPLMEEYAVAMQVWHLSAADTCEIARNSCLASCFEHPFLSHWLGPDYRLAGPAGSDISRTNVPYIRLQYRLETLQGEFDLLRLGAASSGHATGPTRQTSSSAFLASRRAPSIVPSSVPHSPGSGRPLFTVVSGRKNLQGDVQPTAGSSAVAGSAPPALELFRGRGAYP